MGTQRRKAEHVLFKSHFERRTSSTKRLHTTSAKSGSEDHTTLFRASHSVASSQAVLTENRRIGRKSSEIHARSCQNRQKIDLELSWASKIVLGTPPDAFGTAFGHPNDGPSSIQGRPGWAKSGQELSKCVPGQPQRRSKSLRDNSQDARDGVRVTKRNRKRWQMDFASNFDRCAEAPKCVSHWFLQGFVDVGRFAHGAFTAWKNFEKSSFGASQGRSEE